MEVCQAIYSRRSVRKFTDRPVERETLRELCRLGAAAPSAVNRCPWEFVAITDPVVMDQLRACMNYGKYNAPAAIVVCGNMLRALQGTAQMFWVQDTAAAMENILLGAVGMDLGGVWLGCYPMEHQVQVISDLLHLPEHIVPMGIAYIGYPAEQPPARTQLENSQLHFEGYVAPSAEDEP